MSCPTTLALMYCSNHVEIDARYCIGKTCSRCVKVCSSSKAVFAITDDNKIAARHFENCLGCLKCVKACPADAFSVITKEKHVDKGNCAN